MRAVIAALLGALLLAAPAAAQFGAPVGPGAAQPGAARPPPPALPGLRGRAPIAPIPGDPEVSLAPNAALFDAINRGDLVAARDAVARGAEIDARNVLGLTPTDAAVDQGRSEILFYLLSVRGAIRPPEPRPEAPASPPPARAAGRAATPRAATTAAPVAPAAVVGARLFAGDGGTPLPEIGFLGFDAGRPAGAAPPAPRLERARRS